MGMNALADHETFIRDLLRVFKEKPMLWHQNHPQYRNRLERARAYEVLVEIARQYYPEADEDYVKTRIESMRSCFRKERKKVLQSKQECSDPESVHKPSLWYYDLLLFTVGEEANENNTTDDKNEQVLAEHVNALKSPFWSKEQTAILINFYKNHPCLYSATHPSYKIKRRRVEALRKVTRSLISATGKFFRADDVRKKISMVRGQFLHEYRKIQSSEKNGEHYKPTLWCFEMLSFLMDQYTHSKDPPERKRSLNSPRKLRRKNSSSESENEIEVKKEADSSVMSEGEHTDSCQRLDEDIFDIVTDNLAHQLREMTEQQRSIANRIIRDVMYHGQMENLSYRSRLSLDGN